MDDYRFPQEIDEKIPKHFYLALLGELHSVFGYDPNATENGHCILDFV